MRRNNGLRPVWKLILTDLLIAVLILAGWWLSRVISLELTARRFEKNSAAVSETVPAESSAPVSTVPDDNGSMENETADPPEPTDVVEEPPEIPDNRTELQKRFADYFTDEIIMGEGFYSSPNISITISQGEIGEGNSRSVYYVADIYLGNIECIRSYFAHGQTYPRRTALMPQMFEESGAILAINGDYCGLNFGGILIRNGTVYNTSPNGSDVCILFRDGSVQCMNSRDFSLDDYEEDSILHVWCFGPYMMDGNGNVLEESQMNLPSYISGYNPRTGIGYYEPGHYCFVVVDGRTGGYSKGVYMREFAEIFKSLGCVQAFNLDGGGSTSMMMFGEFVNSPSTSGQRDMPDIILIKEADDSLSG